MRTYKRFINLKEGDTLYELYLDKNNTCMKHKVKWVAKKGRKTLVICTDIATISFNPNNLLSFFHYIDDDPNTSKKIITSDYQGTIAEFKRKVLLDKKILNALTLHNYE